MTKMTLMVLVLAAVGCAGVSQKKQGQEAVVGHWTGAIDRDGWQRQLSVDIANDGNAYGGSWMSVESQPGIMLDRVEVQGDEVRFDLKNLSFDGRLSGRTLSGSVTDKAEGKPSGQFVLTRVDPRVAVIP